MSSKKFKLDDRVIVAHPKGRESQEYEGCIGNICYVSIYSKDCVDVQFDGVKFKVPFCSDELELLNSVNSKSDAVNSPKHYSVFEQLEAIQVIASSMTLEQFYGYCLGNILKYRLRAGGKDDVMQELGKADRYQGLFTENKHLCKEN